MVLHLGEDDDVAATKCVAAPRLGEEVERLGGAVGEEGTRPGGEEVLGLDQGRSRPLDREDGEEDPAAVASLG